jgi:ureidoglycolate lyase/seryl-tRNA synthetase
VTHAPIDYLNPDLPPDLPTLRMPLVVANPTNLSDFGELVDDPRDVEIEIVRWPTMGHRPVDAGTGTGGGLKEGVFESAWDGDVLYGRNTAVGGHYVLAYATAPEDARTGHDRPPTRMLLWHANYHPDGGQLFYPLERRPFYVPLARPGDDVRPEDFVCFVFDGTQGLYIHPNIWHEGVFTLAGRQSFTDLQGAVHARVSVDFAREFGCLLEAPIER